MKNILTFFLLVGSVVAFGFDGLVKTTRNAHTATVQSAALRFVYSGEDSHLAALDKAKEAHPNNQELKEANLAILVVGIVTPYDEFYLLGRALQLAKTTYRVARFSAANLLAKNRKLNVVLDAKGSKLLEDAGTKLDDLVAFEKLAKAGGSLLNQFDNTIARLTGKSKFSLTGTGKYTTVKGHHPMAKKAFEGDLAYDYKEAFSVKVSSLEDAWKTANQGISQNIHGKITEQQNSLYSTWKKANPNKKLSLDEMADIEIQSMVNAGIPEDIATGWVVKSI